MSVSRRCPTCQHPNPDNASVCEHCGAVLPPLSVETVRFADLPEVAAAQRKPISQGMIFPGFLTVYVMDDVNPLVFEDRGTLIMGRSAMGEPSPTINLTRHHAGLLGVSRRHAAIHVSDQEHTITDLNSSNGTWVNQEPLVPGKPRPLRSGDLLRLGHLVLHIYFEEALGNGQVKPAEQITPARPPTSEFGEVSAATIRLVGRPGPVEYRTGQVIMRLLHLQAPPDAPEETTALPVVPTRFTVHMTNEQWSNVREGINEPETALVVEGTCAYGKETVGIVIHAAQVTVQRPANAADSAPAPEKLPDDPPATTADRPTDTNKPANDQPQAAASPPEPPKVAASEPSEAARSLNETPGVPPHSP